MSGRSGTATIYRTSCEGGVNKRYKRTLTYVAGELTVVGTDWEFDSNQGCCDNCTGGGTIPSTPGVAITCDAVEILVPLNLFFTFYGCTGIYAALNGVVIELTYDGDVWSGTGTPEAIAAGITRIELELLSAPGAFFLLTIEGIINIINGISPDECNPPVWAAGGNDSGFSVWGALLTT